MRPISLLVGIIFVSLWGSGCCTTERNTDEILAKIQKANDPNSVIKNMKTEVISSRVKTEGGKEGCLTVKLKFPDSMRIEADNSKEKLIRAYSNGKGWQFSTKMGLREITGKELDAMKFQVAYFAPDTNLKEIFETVTLDGEEIVNGQPCYKLTCTPLPVYKTPPVIIYVNKNTYLVAKTIEKYYIGNGVVDIVKNYDNYESVDGIKIPMSIVSDINGKVVDMTVESVKWNEKIHDSSFNPPEQLEEKGSLPNEK